MSEFFPREWLDTLLSRVDLVDLISARLPLKKKSAQNYFACCPFHQEKSASFSVSEVKQFYHCFGCGAHGNALDFMMNFERMGFVEAVKTLAQQIGLSLPAIDASHSHKGQGQQNLDQDYAIMERVADFYYNELKSSQEAITYLKQRGITGQTAKRFKLGYAPSAWRSLMTHFQDGASPKELEARFERLGLVIRKDQSHDAYDRFRHRIMFPIQDHRGRTVGFGGRVLDQSEPKYLNSPETPLFHKGEVCYGLYQALHKRQQLDKVLIVEGYMDVVALFQHGIDYAVATMGTAVTSLHIKRLLRYTKKIIFCFDGDDAGRLAAKRSMGTIFPLLHDDWQVFFLFLPDGEDPDSLIRKEGQAAFEARFNTASSLSDYFFQILSEDADSKTMEGRAHMTALALQWLKTMPAIMFKEVLLTELARIVRLDVLVLQQRLVDPHYESKTSSSKGEQAKAVQKPRPKKMLGLRTKSPLYKALALLVQYPTLLMQQIEVNGLPFDEPGFQLLHALKGAHPDASLLHTGALLEHWRERPEYELLVKLASWTHVIPEAGVLAEFQGSLRQASLMFLESKINELLAIGNERGLTDAEKQQLTEWLLQKQRPVTSAE